MGQYVYSAIHYIFTQKQVPLCTSLHPPMWVCLWLQPQLHRNITELFMLTGVTVLALELYPRDKGWLKQFIQTSRMLLACRNKIIASGTLKTNRIHASPDVHGLEHSSSGAWSAHLSRRSIYIQSCKSSEGWEERGDITENQFKTISNWISN